MATWDDLVDQAFVNLGVIQPGETITTTMRTTAEVRLNQLLSSLSTEQLTVFQQVSQAFSLQVGVSAYTVGTTGTLQTALRAQKITAWRAYYLTVLSGGGSVMSLAEFGAAAQQQNGELTSIPKIVGADTSYPSINLRVFPPPSSAPGTLEIDYFTPITQVTNFAATVSLADGWEQMLHWGLAVQLYPQYARPGQTIEVIAANFQNAKASLVNQNTMGSSTQQAA